MHIKSSRHVAGLAFMAAALSLMDLTEGGKASKEVQTLSKPLPAVVTTTDVIWRFYGGARLAPMWPSHG